MVFIDEKRLKLAFLEEVNELLDSLNEKLLELEESPMDKDVINEIFRLTHSIKSESALVGFMNISTVAHKMEDIFERVRREVLTVDTRVIDSLFAANDKIVEMIAAVQNDKDESVFDITGVLNPLLNILNEKEVDNVKTTPKSDSQQEQKNTGDDENIESFMTKLEFVVGKTSQITSDLTDYEKMQIEEGLEKGDKFYQIKYRTEKECDMRYPRAYLVYNNLISLGTVVKTIPDIEKETSDDKFIEVEVYFITNSSLDEIKECAEIDQVDRLEINEVELKALVGIMDVSNVSGYNEQIVSSDEIEEAEEIEREWKKQFEASQAQQKTENQEKEKEKDVIEQKKGEKKASVINKKGGVKSTIKKHTIRVDIERLDVLMNLVGELVINSSRFKQIYLKMNEQSGVKADIEDATNELERITELIQMGMMQARMVPIGTVFSKFPRMVRDLANKIHKTVSLEIIGETTEIDRTVVELIAEPLTHLIRNSIDHGIESPEQREEVGKSREGSVILKAYQEGSSIYIEVEDDGKGIDLNAIREKGIEKNIITDQQASSMTPTEILNIIFEPGFSTKEQVTDVSGRGVGMDVVKTQIQKLRGRIDIETKYGKGTKFTIVLPLTLTIVEALLVAVENNIFAIPISVVEETIKINYSEVRLFNDYLIYNLRDETLAVNYLSDLVGLQNVKKRTTGETFLVVVSYERRSIGLIVDDLMGEQDIVIKALDEVLKGCAGIAGGAILGDGKIALILDTSSLVKETIREINQKAGTLEYFNEGGENLDQLYDELNENAGEIEGLEELEEENMSVTTEEKEANSQNSSDENSKTNEENLAAINNILSDIKSNK